MTFLLALKLFLIFDEVCAVIVIEFCAEEL